jgi:hypothetical protein
MYCAGFVYQDRTGRPVLQRLFDTTIGSTSDSRILLLAAVCWTRVKMLQFGSSQGTRQTP